MLSVIMQSVFDPNCPNVFDSILSSIQKNVSNMDKEARVKKTSLGESLAISHAYNPIQDSW